MECWSIAALDEQRLNALPTHHYSITPIRQTAGSTHHNIGAEQAATK
jgi:hypothetical protein